MYRLSRTIVSRLLLAGLCGPLASPFLLAQASVRTVKVLGATDAVEIEVEASDRIVPQTRVLTGPDRLVVDFPNAVPGSQLRSQSVDRGEVKDVRVGLFQGKPPITRIVLDLKTAQSYQVFPSGRTVIIKVMGGGAADVSAGIDNLPSEPATRPGLVVANYTREAERVSVESSAQPALDVTFRDGLLGIRANKVTLSEVLFAVQQRTGAQVSIAAGAEQEKVVADIAPAPAPEVLARLLNGSRFNFLILSAANDPRQLDRVILSARADGGVMPLPPVEVQNNNADEDDPSQPPPLQAQPINPSPAQNPPGSQPEIKSPPDNNAPDQ
jgi:antitoxin (DNA-binding transcriptional repressor) of toxin-antitoxin stability system